MIPISLGKIIDNLYNKIPMVYVERNKIYNFPLTIHASGLELFNFYMTHQTFGKWLVEEEFIYRPENVRFWKWTEKTNPNLKYINGKYYSK